MTNEALIETFWNHHQQGIHFPPAFYGKLTTGQAYAIQLGLIERRRQAGERQIGWKVGLTAPAIQHQFGFLARRNDLEDQAGFGLHGLKHVGHLEGEAPLRLRARQQALRPPLRPTRPDRPRLRE